MKIVLCALGDENELQSFITIANYLNNLNHEVLVVSNSNYKHLCDLYNLEFTALPIDYEEVVKNKMSNIDLQVNSRKYVKKFEEEITASFPILIDSCKNADYVFYNTAIVGITDIAEMHNFNLVKVASFPYFYPSSKLRNPLANNLQFSKEQSYNINLEKNVINIINKQRAFYFQKEKRKSDEFKYFVGEQVIKHVLVNSQYIYDQDIYTDEPDAIMAGFLTFPALKTLSSDILEFLNNHHRPILVDIDTDNINHLENFLRALKATSDKFDDCGVIFRGEVNEQIRLKFTSIYFANSESIKLLTSYARVFIHNGNISSYVSAIESNCVSLPIPIRKEQVYFTQLFEDSLICLPRLSDSSNITSERILKALKNLETPELIQNIEKLSLNLASEDVLRKIHNFVFEDIK